MYLFIIKDTHCTSQIKLHEDIWNPVEILIWILSLDFKLQIEEMNEKVEEMK